jgi:hypothetical protein
MLEKADVFGRVDVGGTAKGVYAVVERVGVVSLVETFYEVVCPC